MSWLNSLFETTDLEENETNLIDLEQAKVRLLCLTVKCTTGVLISLLAGRTIVNILDIISQTMIALN